MSEDLAMPVLDMDGKFGVAVHEGALSFDTWPHMRCFLRIRAMKINREWFAANGHDPRHASTVYRGTTRL